MFGLEMSAIYALFQVAMIDLVLAGDNAIVIGMAAAGLDKSLRSKAILIGILAATVLRILFAIVATQLLQLTGLLLAGGILLLWVCWKMWQELRTSATERAHGDAALDAATDGVPDGADPVLDAAPRKTLRQAVTQIIIADVSMSLDNVLAVAGAAHDHLGAMVFGLSLSVVLMGVASSVIAKLLHKHRWIAWLGLLVIVYVAINMIFDGTDDLTHGGLPYVPFLKG
ncbi:TerC family protein [Rhizobium sp. C1]|uniref:TerC family protein n=1 Tax=Rhizobium sp. C1 TaxID=1349799 RepID=UPI001E590B38|nr:TerC family protein [Rhizobium sp. C1]MCD2176782.1 TerC family protein [Rhizobium sp. C1]